MESPIKDTKELESGTGATQELFTPEVSAVTVESKEPEKIVDLPIDDTETSTILSGESSEESEIESDMEAISGTAKRPASPVASPKTKLKKHMEEIEAVVKKRR